MVEKTNSSNMVYISLVAIVAIVAMVVLLTGHTGPAANHLARDAVYSQAPAAADSDNLGGQATSMRRGSSSKSINSDVVTTRWVDGGVTRQISQGTYRGTKPTYIDGGILVRPGASLACVASCAGSDCTPVGCILRGSSCTHFGCDGGCASSCKITQVSTAGGAGFQ